jgi:hypothetical protein
MAFQSFGQVLSAADIVTLIFFGLEDIYEEGVNGRDKVSQKWSFKSEPLWKGLGNHSMV